MRHLATDALILHAFDYRETSRLVRLATRDAGVISVVARGAKRPKSRFGGALDLFTDGVAQLTLHPTGDLHTLTGFDSAHFRPELAVSLDRFAAASALSELCLRFGRAEDTGRFFEAIVGALDAVRYTEGPLAIASVALASAWRLIAELGFAPALESCASCHAELGVGIAVTFHHRAGGTLCDSCARQARGGRRLPEEARRVLSAWMRGETVLLSDSGDIRAHQRLLREFLEEHLGDGRTLNALVAWEERRI